MFHVMRHELRLIFREPRFWIPFLIPPVILVASQGIAVGRYGGQIMEGLEGYMALLLGCLMAPMGAPLAADSFAGERERNSLELLQLSPVKPAAVFWGKLLAVLPFSLVFSLLAILVYWFSHPMMGGATVVASFLGSASVCFLVTTFTLLISLNAKSVRSATQSSLFLVVPMLLAVQFFYQEFLGAMLIPVVTLAVSLAICGIATMVGVKKFVSM
ncbi:MAG: ABC transporter permease [Fibrobacter sp.]|nr:ABC transporter permease [Fibrobacter sp.]